MPIVLDGTNGIDTPDLAATGPISGTTGTFTSGVSVGPSITFGDATTQTTAAVVNTTTVRTATAGAAADAVGTYAFLRSNTATNYAAGDTAAGSNFNFSSAFSNGTQASGATPSGTWRAMGSMNFSSANMVSVWLRIS